MCAKTVLLDRGHHGGGARRARMLVPAARGGVIKSRCEPLQKVESPHKRPPEHTSTAVLAIAGLNLLSTSHQYWHFYC